MVRKLASVAKICICKFLSITLKDRIDMDFFCTVLFSESKSTTSSGEIEDVHTVFY